MQLALVPVEDVSVQDVLIAGMGELQPQPRIKAVKPSRQGFDLRAQEVNMQRIWMNVGDGVRNSPRDQERHNVMRQQYGGGRQR